MGQAARAAADAFGYQGGSPSFAPKDHAVLDRSKTLAAAHVRDGDILELVDVPAGEQNRQGPAVGNTYTRHKMKDGDQFLVVITSPSKMATGP